MRIAIVTAVCGSRDILCDPSIIYDGVDYHAFVDREFPAKIWRQQALTPFSTDSRFAARRHARIYKVLPHLFLPGYDFHLWVDATHEVVADPREMIEAYLQDFPMAVFKHHARTCAYDEARVILDIGIDHADLVERQLGHYLACGFPAGYGLYETSAFIRRSCPESNKLSLMWWDQICRFSSRDQVSFPFVVWKLGIPLAILEGFVQGVQPESGVVAYNRLVPQVRRHVACDELESEVSNLEAVRAFSSSADVRLAMTAPNELATGSVQALHDVRVSAGPSGIVLHATGDDPYVALPTFTCSSGSVPVVRVDITSPADTVLEVFYETAAAPGYEASRRCWRMVKQGRNQVYIELAASGLTGRLRLDPGKVPGDYILHALEVRATPAMKLAA